MNDSAAAAQGSLAEAFSAFISASASLELSYRELQAEVAELSLALSERNQALTDSLSQNRSMGLTLQRILDAIPCGVFVSDDAGRIRLANPEAARLLALSAAQMPSLALIEEQTGLDLAAGLELAATTEQELCFDSSGGRHWMAVRCVPLPSADADTKSGAETIFTLQDISARKRAEQEREKSRDAVALAQVSALLAHEIRNPLASLELFAGLIADSPERRDEWLSHLRAGIRSLSGTVNNVLTLHGAATLRLERVERNSEAQLAVDFLQPLAKQHGVALQLETGPEPSWILANKSAFQQLLLNLCSNALRHTPAGGNVRVQCIEPGPGDRVQIAVTDDGCGIAREHLSHLFEGGFSGSGTTPGLGLTVCERLMRQHGGTIRVHSRPGEGSTFTLEFQTA